MLANSTLLHELMRCAPEAAVDLLAPSIEQATEEFIFPITSKEDPDHTGAVVSCWRHRLNATEEELLFGIPAGHIQKDSAGRSARLRTAQYATFSMIEKPTRLMAERVAKGHASSYQSRNPHNNMWGGAFWIFDQNLGWFYISTSGLPEKADEATGISILAEAGLVDRQQFRRVLAASDNGMWSHRLENRYQLELAAA